MGRSPHGACTVDRAIMLTLEFWKRFEKSGVVVKAVAIVGNGQLAVGVARALSRRSDIRVTGPTSRVDQRHALNSGADVVVIATATLLGDVCAAIETAIVAGSNVIVSAEEAAYPVAVDGVLARRLDALARANGVTVLGAGLNPGFIFDSLVLTLLGTVTEVRGIDVTRTVDISGFGPAVRARLGLGVDLERFGRGVTSGEILGHAGFPQSISLVAGALGVALDRIDTSLEPIVDGGITVGVRQVYTGIVGGTDWFRATFVGHIDLEAVGLRARDEIRIDGTVGFTCVIDPGVGSQAGSQAIIANSIDRVIAAPPGWITVADLPPAHPYSTA